MIHGMHCMSDHTFADYLIGVKTNSRVYDKHILQEDVVRPNLEALHYDLTNNQDYFQEIIMHMWRARLILYKGKNK